MLSTSVHPLYLLVDQPVMGSHGLRRINVEPTKR